MDQNKIQAYKDEQKRLAERSQELKAVKEVGDKVDKSASYQSLKTEQVRKELRNVTNALSTLTDRVAPKELKEVVDSLKDVTGQIEQLAKVIPQFPEFPEFPEIPEFPDKVGVNNISDIKPWLADVVKAVNKLKLDPKINVSASPVNVTAPEVDFTPLIKALNKTEKKTVDINDFRAQDIDEEEQDIQYVGFVAPNGNWMIIRNDVVGNNMRYKFGAKDYEKAWPKLATYKYDTLDKAINEIKA